jgi:hypothetical protein
VCLIDVVSELEKKRRRTKEKEEGRRRKPKGTSEKRVEIKEKQKDGKALHALSVSSQILLTGASCQRS